MATVIFCETGFLGNDRTSGGEVTGAPIAEPTGVEPDVLIFCDCELAFRLLDIIAVEPVIDAHLHRRSESPTVALEFLPRFSVLNVCCELESFTGFFRRAHKTQKFPRLAPEIFSPPPGDVFQSASRPIRDGSENCRLFGSP